MRIFCSAAALLSIFAVEGVEAAPALRGSDIHYTQGKTIELARTSNISSVNCNPTEAPKYRLSAVVSGKLRIEQEVRVLRDGEGPFHDPNVRHCEGKQVTEYVLYYEPTPGFLGHVPVNYTVTYSDGSSSSVADVVVVEKAAEQGARCPSLEERRAIEKAIVAKSRRTKAAFVQCHDREI